MVTWETGAMHLPDDGLCYRCQHDDAVTEREIRPGYWAMVCCDCAEAMRLQAVLAAYYREQGKA